MIEPHQLPQLMAIFSAGYLALACILMLLFGHALRKRAQLDLDAREIFLTQVSIGAAAIQAFTASVPGFTIYYSIMGAKKRRLQESIAAREASGSSPG